MKNFSIDVKASGKEEMKKVRKYLRGLGYDVAKRQDNLYPECNQKYLLFYNDRFDYFDLQINELIITLPQDWDKLVETVEVKNKQSFEDGKWYKSISGTIYKYLGKEKFIDSKGNSGKWHFTTLGLATELEILDTLVKEAKRRGYESNVFKYDLKRDILLISPNCVIYCRGFWSDNITGIKL